MGTEPLPIIDPAAPPGPSQEEIEARARAAREKNLDGPAGGQRQSLWGSDDNEQYVSKKGWTDPSQVLQSYREVERETSRMSQELADARAELQSLSEYVMSQEGGQEFQQQNPQVPTNQVEAMQRWVGQFQDPVTGEVDLANMMLQMSYLQAQATEERLNAREQAQLEKLQTFIHPLEEAHDEQVADQVMGQMSDVYGDNFEPIADLVDEIYAADPDFWESMATQHGMEKTISLAFAQANQQLTQQTVRAQREQADAFTIGAGGRSQSGRRMTPQEAEKAQIFGLAAQKNDDIFGADIA